MSTAVGTFHPATLSPCSCVVLNTHGLSSEEKKRRSKKSQGRVSNQVWAEFGMAHTKLKTTRQQSRVNSQMGDEKTIQDEGQDGAEITEGTKTLLKTNQKKTHSKMGSVKELHEILCVLSVCYCVYTYVYVCIVCVLCYCVCIVFYLVFCALLCMCVVC